MKVLVDEMYDGMDDYIDMMGHEAYSVKKLLDKEPRLKKDQFVVDYAEKNGMVIVTADTKMARRCGVVKVRCILIGLYLCRQEHTNYSLRGRQGKVHTDRHTKTPARHKGGSRQIRSRTEPNLKRGFRHRVKPVLVGGGCVSICLGTVDPATPSAQCTTSVISNSGRFTGKRIAVSGISDIRSA